MYQFSLQVKELDNGFDHVIKELKDRVSSAPAKNILFHIYSSEFDLEKISDMIGELRHQFEGSQIVFATTAGSVFDYSYQPGIFISVDVFEYQDSLFEVHSYELSEKTEKNAAEEIVQFVHDHPWVKAIQLYRTTHDFNVNEMCRTLSQLPEDILIFGGLSVPEVVLTRLSYVADQSGKMIDQGGVVIYYGGNDLHVQTYSMSGWKPIDREFIVTKSEGATIKELDGIPANLVLKRYLDIDDDPETIQENTLEFPLFCEDHDWRLIRNIFGLDPNGGLMIATHLHQGAKVRICFADTLSIVEGINMISNNVIQFTPDALSITSCITRDMIWRVKDYLPELSGFKSIAPTHGFLAHGELIRINGLLALQNTLMVVAAFREGDLKDVTYPEISLNFGPNVPLVARLGTFINRVTQELKDMYSEVERVATTDALTGIGNRYLFDDAVNEVSSNGEDANKKYLLMFDLNGLKFVNDTYGHNEGDEFLKTASDIIAEVFSTYGQCFRIGGDEFAVIASFENNDEMEKALDTFYGNIKAYNEASPYTLTMAVGYAPLVNKQGKMLTVSDWKMTADINMYLDKTKFHSIEPMVLNPTMSEFFTDIISLIDNKNAFTAYHSVRVQRMSVMIAKFMQLEDEVIDRVNLGSYLHDIGRLGISDIIVTKAKGHSEEELVLLKQKPIIGRRLLNKSEETKPVADIVYACYEQWDGQGYPEGLSKEKIPVESRIIAVADYLDKCLHGWYDQPAVRADECIDLLIEKSGSMFDPTIISIVIANFGDIIKGDMKI